MSQTRILIVEDEPVIVLDIEESLIALGYEVVAVADCAEAALAAIDQTHPDLVLMDIQLRGDQTGIEIANQVWQQYHLPVVFLTAHADEATLAQMGTVQLFGYIVKPFEIRDLRVVLEVALRRYQTEVAIQKALEQEKALNEMKSRFVSVMSHEFRNPLSSILISLDLLAYPEQQIAPDKQQVYLKRAKTAVERMIQLLDDMLIISETDTPQFEYHPAPLALVKFCQDLIEQLQIRPEAPHSVRFNPVGFSTPNQIHYFDKRLLHYILINLLSNAIKYSPSNEEIVFDLVLDGALVVFRVQDQGIGIARNEQAHLFDAFYRGTNVGNIPGTGLGLSIVKQCVELHRGQISVESQPGVGTTFIVTFNQQLMEWAKCDEKNLGD